MASERRWLTIPEASTAYGLHTKTLYELCRRRLVPHSRIPSLRGGRGMVRIDAKKFNEMLEADEVVLDTKGRRR